MLFHYFIVKVSQMLIFFLKIYIEYGHMVSLNSQPLKTADKGSAILIIGHDSCEQRIKMKFTRFNFLVNGIRCKVLAQPSTGDVSDKKF